MSGHCLSLQPPVDFAANGVQLAHLPDLFRIHPCTALAPTSLGNQEDQSAAGQLRVLRRVESAVRFAVVDINTHGLVRGAPHGDVRLPLQGGD